MVRVWSVAIVVLSLLPVPASAVGLSFASNPQDDRHFPDDPKVRALKVEVADLRDRMMRWRERDFNALFGKPFEPGERDYALMCSEGTMLLQGGMGLFGAENDKSHTVSYRIGDGARVDVYFQRDGETPGCVLFYLKVDEKFVRLERADQLEARVTWERTALWQAIRHTNDRWREIIGWEIDTEKKAKLFVGLDSPEPTAKLKPAIEWAEKQKLVLKYTKYKEPGDSFRRWYRDDVLMAEVDCRGDIHGDEKPCSLIFYRTDGTRLRDEQRVLNCVPWARWYHTDGTLLRWECFARQSSLGREWTEASWSWCGKDGKAVRKEEDTNGDGLPDMFVEWVNGKTSERQPLVIEKSWACHAELVPVELRIPDQPGRHLPVRKIAREK